MDITPDGVNMRTAIAALPEVRQVWEFPPQDLWVARILDLLRESHPGLVEAVDQAEERTADQIGQELDLYDGVYVITRGELRGIVTKSAHTATAVAAVAVGEALDTINRLERDVSRE